MANNAWKETETNIENNLKQNANDMQPVYKELDELKQNDSQEYREHAQVQESDHWALKRREECHPDIEQPYRKHYSWI